MPQARNTGQMHNRASMLQAARAHIGRRSWREAMAILAPLEKKNQKDAEVCFLMGLVFEGIGDPTQARQHARRALAITDNPPARLLLGRTEQMLGNTDEALRQFERVERFAPLKHNALLLRGATLEEAGRFEEAREILEPMVLEASSSGPVPPNLMTQWMSLLAQLRRDDEAIQAADTLIGAGAVDERVKQHAHKIKSKVFDRKHDYAAAFEAARAANRLSRAPFSPDQYEKQATSLIEFATRERLDRFPLSACTSELPVFIAGMPRSGTSLVDRIIDAHPLASGVGEIPTIEVFASRIGREYNPAKEPPECFGSLQEPEWTRAAEQYVRDMKSLGAKGSERVVNKSLQNYKVMFAIARLFPKARVIHTIRDPRDIAVSCYMGSFNNARFPWTARLDWIVAAWEQSMRVMDHWRETLDIPILDVKYEALVRDPEPQFRRIIEFLGLDWDERCLAFHESGRAVRTLSYDQVIRPIYTSSVARHRNYAPFLEGVAFPDYSPE